jgi:hypothetical protein
MFPELHPYRHDGSVKPPMPIDSFKLDGLEHWEVERILAPEHRVVGERINIFFKVRWACFSSEHDTFEFDLEANVENCSAPSTDYKAELVKSGSSLEPAHSLLIKAKAK